MTGLILHQLATTANPLMEIANEACALIQSHGGSPALFSGEDVKNNRLHTFLQGIAPQEQQKVQGLLRKIVMKLQNPSLLSCLNATIHKICRIARGSIPADDMLFLSQDIKDEFLQTVCELYNLGFHKEHLLTMVQGSGGVQGARVLLKQFHPEEPDVPLVEVLHDHWAIDAITTKFQAVITLMPQWQQFGLCFEEIALVGQGEEGRLHIHGLCKFFQHYIEIGFTKKQTLAISKIRDLGNSHKAIFDKCKKLLSLRFSAQQIVRLFTHCRSMKAVDVLLKKFDELEGLGLDQEQMIRLAIPLGAHNALEAVIAHKQQLQQLGFTLSQIVEMGALDKGAKRIEEIVSQSEPIQNHDSSIEEQFIRVTSEKWLKSCQVKDCRPKSKKKTPKSSSQLRSLSGKFSIRDTKSEAEVCQSAENGVTSSVHIEAVSEPYAALQDFMMIRRQLGFSDLPNGDLYFT